MAGEEVLTVIFRGKDELSDHFNRVGKVAGGVLLGGVAAAGAGFAIFADQVMTGFDSLMRIERIGAQTQAVIESTGGAAGFTAQQIEDMAGSLEDLTATEAESTQQAANLLLTYTNIGQETFPDALAAVLDMGRAMDRTGSATLDMTTYATMVGKALQDPIQGMAALRRVGVNFNEEAVATVQNLIDIGDVAGAQKFILAELATEFGGSAEAFAQTTQGKLELVKHQFGTLQEQLAGPFLSIAADVFTQFLDFLKSPEIQAAITAITDLFAQLGQIFTSSITMLRNGMPVMDVLQGILARVAMALGVSSGEANAFATQVRTLIDQVVEFIRPIVEWIQNNIELKDVLAGLGILVASVVIPAIVSLISTLAPIILTIGAVILAVSLVRRAWENDWGGIRTFLLNVWENSIRPAVEQLREWLAVNIPIAIERLKEFWENVLLPAITTVWQWIQENVFPIIATLIDVWLEGLKLEIQALAAFWTNVLWPAIQQVAAWIVDNLVPIFQQVVAWLAENIPIAIQTAKDFWENTLKPALEAVWAFIQDNVIPIFVTVVEWLQTNIPVAIETLRGFWEDVLLPAINAVWAFIQDDLLPLFEALADFIDATLSVVLTAMAGIWENVIAPALEKVWGWLQDNILPILKDVWAFIQDNIVPLLEGAFKSALDKISAAFETLKTAISKVTDFLRDLADRIRNIRLPDWMTPGSPMPLETAFWGLAEAIDAVAAKSLPRFQTGVDILPSDLERVALRTSARIDSPFSSGEGNGQTINYYNLSYTTQRSLEDLSQDFAYIKMLGGGFNRL